MPPGYRYFTCLSAQGANLLWRGGALKEPTAPYGVKEHRYCLARGHGRLAGRTPCRDDTLIHMTLGNGYLGSRIDEERSKMRYLV